MVTISDILSIIVFPGALFIVAYALYCNWLIRKTVARLQNRRGPMHTGAFGLLQPFADIVKLLAKEDITPSAANRALFLGAWSSSNAFGAIGATRVALATLAYEIPLVLLALGPAIMAGSMSISNI